VTAEVVNDDYESFEAYGSETVAKSRSFIFDIADYKINGVVVTPASGDQIQETIAGIVHTFEVMPIGSSPCYEWVGTQKPQWKVHTKFVGTA